MRREDFDQIVSCCGKDILRFCRFTAGSREDGDELYQDTMLKLLEHPERIESPDRAKSVAIQTAIHLWKSRKRIFARRNRLAPTDSLDALFEDGYEPAAVSEESPEEKVLHRQDIRSLRALICTLPDKYRLPLLMYYSADMQIREIAAALGLTETAVKTRLHRAKEMLRKELQP